MNQRRKVSIAVSAHNEAAHIRATLESILGNSFDDFELIVVDDASSDETSQLLASVTDARLRVIRNVVRAGPAVSLNTAARLATGEFIFFTDADCIVARDWLGQGLRAFRAAGGCEDGSQTIIGVEGDIYYPVVPNSIRYKVPCNPFYHSFSRRISRPARDFASGNIAFRREVFLALGGFNEADYGSARQDTEFAWRALKAGRIVHNPTMRVEHRLEMWTLRGLFRSAARYEKDVLFFKEHGFFFFSWRRVLHPQLLLFPRVLWKYRRMPLRDYILLPGFLLYVLLLRLFIWRGALRYRTFVI
jgi:glycosyltransferase involved in cell wall biosynthesis